MIFLVLTILTTSLLFFIFKLFEKFEINTFQAIVANYVTCVFTGLIFNPQASEGILNFELNWAPFSLMMGCIFIAIFNLIGLTVKMSGISAVSVSTKISMVIPIIFSLAFLDTSHKEFNFLNYSGLVLSLLAVYFTSKKETNQKVKKSGLAFLLPIVVFLCTGIADSIMNFANSTYLSDDTASWFTVSTFFYSASIGSLLILYRTIILKNKLSLKSIFAGVILGIPNFFSIYFLLRTLSAFDNDGAFMFPITNIGVILFSILISTIVFKEHLSKHNKLGVLMAILAIVLISYQEIFNV